MSTNHTRVPVSPSSPIFLLFTLFCCHCFIVAIVFYVCACFLMSSRWAVNSQHPKPRDYKCIPPRLPQCFDYSYFFKLHFILNLPPIIRLLRLGSEIGREQRSWWGKHTWKVMTSWLMALGFQSPCLGHLQGCTLGETPTRALPSTCLCLMPFGALGDLESLCVAHGSSRHKGSGENVVLETSGNR